MGKWTLFLLAPALSLAVFAGCAAPSPTATPTSPPAAVVATPTKAPTATPTKRPIVKATAAFASVSLTYMPVWVARGKGFFQEEGLDVDWVATGSGAKAVAGVIGRSIDIGMNAAPDVISAVGQVQPIQAFAVVSIRQAPEIEMRAEIFQSKGLTAKSTLEERVKALKGLRIAASSPGSGSDYAVRYLLAKYNINPERDLEMTYISLQNMLAALKQGSVDVIVTTPPDTIIAETEGYGKVLISYPRGDVPETNDTLFIVPNTHKDNFQSKPEVLEGFVRATWKGMRLLKENRDDSREAAYKSVFPEMDAAVYRIAFDVVYETIPSSPAVTEKAFAVTLDYRNKTTTEPPLQIKFEDFYTPKFVEAAKKQLGY